MPQISLWSTPPSPQHSHSALMPANTIDLSKFADHAFSYDQVLSRLQRLAPISSPNPFLYNSRSSSLDPSPTSSMTSSSASLNANPPQETFFSTRSRVVRLYNLPAMAESFLSAVFLPHNVRALNAMEQRCIPVPATMWELREGLSTGRRDSVWAVFRTHEEACVALALSGRTMSVATALESDLEPFHKLHRFILRDPASNCLAPTSMRNNNNNTGNNTLDLPSLPPLRVSSSLSDLQASFSSMSMSNSSKVSSGEYTLSSNPPNPKTSFRLGDWICNSPNCAAHNFGLLLKLSSFALLFLLISMLTDSFPCMILHRRNLACIGCGCPRSNSGNTSGANMHQHQHHQHQGQQGLNTSTSRAIPSPRFNTMANNVTYYSTGPPPTHTFQAPQQHREPQQHLNVHPIIGQSHPPSPFGASSSTLPHATNPPKSTHPLLTPSGRAFAVGGKVQNISSDPLSPCIMYWPDNEPFPEQGQIRPNGLIGVAQPPILNTGNRGPISHVTGFARNATTLIGDDERSAKLAFLGLPFLNVVFTLNHAEGNGDSISAAVQAERIALLTSVLSQTQINGGNLNIPSATQAPRSHSLTPPQAKRPFIDVSPPQTVNRTVHRSQSHFALGQQFVAQSPPFTASSPIYQTSGNRQPSPFYSIGSDVHRNTTVNARANMDHLTPTVNGGINSNLQTSNHVGINAQSVNNSSINNTVHSTPISVHAPAPLLPSFLQDIVQSPALSPTSTTTSSADLSSVEEYEDFQSPRASMFPRARGDSGSSDVNSPIANIWRLDGEESKSLSAFPLPNHHELVGARKASGEKLRFGGTPE
ncbi:LOW QUALITY PROTEIN: hypothetical protein CVT25_013119 [Psilocybe cyanescens]|uniref:RRM domain-containing protein n=1 Tax=Psilocybe cyanescens TaxID=93625 RepID=A0A409XHR3_PSICY|nr:LOW QUALITY PROTEIN: hypothetical protein CVT25_013119 [Psilocybe cyanescens]